VPTEGAEIKGDSLVLRSELRGSVAAAPAFIALSCVGFIASASPALAEDAAPADKRLGGVTVTGTAIEDDIKVEKAESPKYVRPLLDTPQTITVISNQTIRQQNLLTLRDVLSTVPGITFGAGEGGGGYGDSINLRGQSANTDITIDGVRDSAQYSRTDPFNLQQIEVINGANSVYGGSGSVGGTINLVTKRPQAEDLTVLQAGIGTDNYYRATVDSNIRASDMIAFRLNAMYHENDVPGRDVDRYKRWGVAPSIKIGVEGPTSLTFTYLHQKDDNTPQYGVPYYNNGIYDGPLPGASDSSYFGYRNVDYQKQTVDQATMIFDHQFSDLVSVRNLSRWQRIEQNLVVDPPQGTYCLAATNRTPADGACTVDLDTRTGAGQVLNITIPAGYYLPSGPRGNGRFSENQTMYNQLDVTFNIPGGHTLVVGGSYMAEDYNLNSGNVLRNADGTNPVAFSNSAPNANQHLPYINIANPNDVVAGPVLPGGIYGSNVYTGPLNYIATSSQDSEVTNLAVYAFTAIKLAEQLELNGGLRYERNKSTFTANTIANGVVTRGVPQVGKDNLFSYRVGLVYKPVENASLYVAYGNSRNPVATSVRSGCGLATAAGANVDPCGTKPEEAVNYEIGGKIDLFDAKLQLTAALFRNERTGYRVASNDPFFGTLQLNDGRNRVDGLALGASGKITPAWSIFANYTYLDTKVKQSISDYCRDNLGTTGPGPGGTTVTCPTLDAQAGNPLTNVPKHSGSLFTTYTLPFGLQIGYGLTYQGSFYLNNARTTPTTVLFKTDDYLTHRAFVSYPVTPRLTAQLNVQNFTNEKYYTSIRNNGWAVPGEDRSAVFSLFYSF
jgi:catecholate siderophore receptor